MNNEYPNLSLTHGMIWSPNLMNTQSLTNVLDTTDAEISHLLHALRYVGLTRDEENDYKHDLDLWIISH